MNKKDALTIVVPVIGTILVLALTDLRVFQPTPDFNIKFESQPESVNDYILTVANVGRTQAKNVDIKIAASHSMDVSSIFCPEGTGSAENGVFLSTITFAKMSTNVQCQIKIADSSGASSNVTRTYYLSVTGDDAPGRQLTLNVLPQKPEDKSQGSDFFAQPVPEVILTILTGISASMAGYQVSRLIKNKEQKQRLKEREVGLEQEIKEATEELEFLERSTSGQQNVPSAIQDRMQFLEDRISRLSESLAQIRGMVQTSEDTRVYVGDFFTKWAILERELVRIAEKRGFDVKRPNPGRTAEYLYRKEALSRSFVEDFESVRNFRNQMAHGAIIPSQAELKKNIVTVEKLLDDIKGNNITP